MPIRWKVVRIFNDARESATVGSFSKCLTRYYQKGTTVKAYPGSFGLCCFTKLQYAKDWVERLQEGWLRDVKLQVIRVRGIGRGKRPKWLPRDPNAYVATAVAKEVFADGPTRRYSAWPVPKGTICYQEVEVLD